MKFKYLLTFCAWLLLPLSTIGAELPTKIWIDYSNEKLSVDIQNAPLKNVLERLTEQTAQEFWLNDELADTYIDVSFKGLELDDGLKKILRRVNHAFIYGPNRNILKVAIFGKITKEFPNLHPEEHLSEIPQKADMTNESFKGPEMTIEPPSGPDMIVTLATTDDPMVILPPSGEPMVISQPDDDPMVILPPSGEPMVISQPKR